MRYPALLFLFTALICFAGDKDSFGQVSLDSSRFSPQTGLVLSDLNGDKDLKQAITSWLSALMRDDAAEAFSASERIESIKDRLGTNNLVTIADMAIAIGYQGLTNGEINRAAIAGEHAVLFAPNYPKANFFAAWALFQKDKTDFRTISAYFASGAAALLDDRIDLARFLSVATGRVFVAALLAFLLIFLAFIAANFRAMIAEVATFLPSVTENYRKTILAVLVFLVPLAVGGWFVFLLFIPLFLWPYLRKRGQVVAALFAVLILSAPSVFEYMAKGMVLSNADTFRALYLLSKDTWDFQTKEALEREAIKGKNDKTITFALGLLNKLAGNSKAAIDAYDSLLKHDPKDLRSLVNKGNVYFASGAYSQAAEQYKKAIKLDPTSVHAHFNLSSAHLKLINTKEAETEGKAAFKLDPDLTAEFRERSATSEWRKVIDFPITSKDLARFEKALAIKTTTVAGALWSLYFGPITGNVYHGIVFGFLFLLVFASLFWQRKISHQVCQSCGSPFRPPILLTSETPKCNQCVAVRMVSRGGLSSTTKSGITSTKKERKRIEIRIHQNRRATVASIFDRILPGVGRAYYDESVFSFGFVLVTAFFIVYAIAQIVAEQGVGASITPEILTRHAIFLGLAGAYWVLMNTVFNRDYY